MLSNASRVTAPLIREAKGKEQITVLTAYDFQIARIVDNANIDIVLIGDSLENVYRGSETTLTATLPQMIYHSQCVSRAVKRALCILDMPFGSYHVSRTATLRNAVRAVKQGGVSAIKLEGGVRMAKTIEAIVKIEIPVMAHIGLTPQSYHRMGGFKKQKARDLLLADAKAVADAGAFAVVLEVIDAEIAAEITNEIAIPTIGIGSGPSCDGQVLVVNDLIGLLHTPSPSFAKRYADVSSVISDAVKRYAADVREKRF
ncbi:MAG: 3-methyl-2-oxobutanoate hydroxymethyltransferase [Spirochaetes bacterium]|nr:3-methyl-2-oxobutanoate hydroxymethyltransferase [Spirochaetota bacterium]